MLLFARVMLTCKHPGILALRHNRVDLDHPNMEMATKTNWSSVTVWYSMHSRMVFFSKGGPQSRMFTKMGSNASWGWEISCKPSKKARLNGLHRFSCPKRGPWFFFEWKLKLTESKTKKICFSKPPFFLNLQNLKKMFPREFPHVKGRGTNKCTQKRSQDPQVAKTRLMPDFALEAVPKNHRSSGSGAEGSDRRCWGFLTTTEKATIRTVPRESGGWYMMDI